MVSTALFHATNGVDAITAWHKKPHRPVMSTAKSNIDTLLKLVVRRPPPLPVTKPIGPSPRQQPWGLPLALAMLAAETSETLEVHVVATLISKVWVAIANTAEKEVAASTGTE